MSQNTDQKDKILIEPNSNSKRQGSISLDPTDAEGFMEHFSRLSPGDEVSGKFKATLDEAGQKVVLLSLTELEVDKPDEEEDDEGAPESGEGDGKNEEPAAVQVVKNEDGVPENDDNLPPEAMPTH